MLMLDYSFILVFALLGVGFVFALLFVGSLLRPKVYNKTKDLPYECGEIPIGSGWFNFNPRFYIVSLIFLIFEVEIAFIFPVARIFKTWLAEGRGAVALVELLFFVGVLALGLVYVWRKGDLEWIRTIQNDPATEKAPSLARPLTPAALAPDTLTTARVEETQ